MPRRWLSACALACVAASACRGAPQRLEPVPEAYEARVVEARAAAAELKKTLTQRLQQAIGQGGPASGVEVCAEEAGRLTEQVSAARGVTLGRTSHRVRNSTRNAPRPWLQGYLAEVAGKPAAEVRPAVYDLGDSLGVVEVLPTLPLCLSCHGDAEQLAPEVRARLSERYPADAATGFRAGEVRGVVWVELRK